MMTNHQNKKILIINWKWRNIFESHVNEKIFSDEEFQFYIKNIDEGKGKFFEEFAVEKSKLCQNAMLVAVSIYKTEGNDNTKQLLYALIDKYAQAGNQVMVFLHRSNFYDGKDVNKLLKHFGKRVAKCFLFAFGRDYIYYNTCRSGLLNDTGGFFRGRDEITDHRVIVYNKERSLVKQPYFDRVWQYYNTEFEFKVFNLKEELFDCWLPFLLPGKEESISRDNLLEAIKKADRLADGKALFFRLKSFIGYYESDLIKEEEDFDKKTQLKRELETIKKLEKKVGSSYVFDDCIVNLEHDKSSGRFLVKDVYEDTKEKLEGLLFNGKKSSFGRKELLEVAGAMENLVKVIPGEID